MSAAVLLAATTVAHAQELRPAPGFWMRLGGNFRTGYSVKFSDTAAPAPAGAGLFSNGFVLPSVSGTNAPYTWNWGYNDAAQVQGNTLVLERFDSRPRVGGLDGGNDVLLGGELRAGFEAVRFEWLDREMRFGFEGGYSMGMLSSSAMGSAAGAASFTRGTYSLVGPGGVPILVPSAPYAGTFNGPGPLIPLQPLGLQTITSAGAVPQRGWAWMRRCTRFGWGLTWRRRLGSGGWQALGLDTTRSCPTQNCGFVRPRPIRVRPWGRRRWIGRFGGPTGARGVTPRFVCNTSSTGGFQPLQPPSFR